MQTTQQANLDRRLKNRFITEHPDGFLIRVWIPGSQSHVQAFVNYRPGKTKARKEAKRLRFQIIRGSRPELLTGNPPPKRNNYHRKCTKNPFGFSGMSITVHDRRGKYYLAWHGTFGIGGCTRSIHKWGYSKAFELVAAMRHEKTGAPIPSAPPSKSAVIENLTQRLGPGWQKHAHPHPKHWS